jgi:hypothetical protein
MNVEVGHIFEVMTDGFLTSDKNSIKRRVKIERGERLEIRYPYAWHFRTEKGDYYQCDEDIILLNCKMLGKVFENVRFNNKATLEEIIRIELYKKDL